MRYSCQEGFDVSYSACKSSFTKPFSSRLQKFLIVCENYFLIISLGENGVKEISLEVDRRGLVFGVEEKKGENRRKTKMVPTYCV